MRWEIWLVASVAIAAAACIEDTGDSAVDDPQQDDAGGQQGRHPGDDPDASTTPDPGRDATRPPPPVGDSGHKPDPVDATMVPDAATPPDACSSACRTFAECGVAACTALREADRGDVEASCSSICDDGLAAALGGLTCGESVALLRGRSDAFAQLCPERRVPDPDPYPCPYPCEDDEVCVQQRCVRENGSCVTDYHCVAGQEECIDGQCVPGEFAVCEDDFECRRDVQSCRRFEEGAPVGYCIVDCVTDEDCPLHQRCEDDGERPPYCYYVYCGGAVGNGEPFETCHLGDAEGICYPLAEGDVYPGGASGICVEGGGIDEGAECDAQSEDPAQQCAPGAMCFGDPDNPLSPIAQIEGRGECADICHPEIGGCAEERTCIDFSQSDEPRTPDYDETRPLGLCLVSDCDVLGGPEACPEGQACRLFGVTDARGHCGPAGDAAIGAPCEGDEDCGPHTICGNDGWQGTRCLQLCLGGDLECGPGKTCWRDPAWPIGACLSL